MPEVLFVDVVAYMPRCGACRHYAAETEPDALSTPRDCSRAELGSFTPPAPEFGCVLFEEWTPDA